MRIEVRIYRRKRDQWAFGFANSHGGSITFLSSWPVEGVMETWFDVPGEAYTMGPFSITAGRPARWRVWLDWLRGIPRRLFVAAHIPLRRSPPLPPNEVDETEAEPGPLPRTVRDPKG